MQRVLFLFLGESGVSMMEMWRCCCCLVFVWTAAWHCCVDFFIRGGSGLSMVVLRRFEVVVGFCMGGGVTLSCNVEEEAQKLETGTA